MSSKVPELTENGNKNSGHGAVYSIEFGNEKLEYREAVIADPVPTGRQLLELSGSRPIEEYILMQVIPDGMLEELRPDETTDLRNRGVEKFLVFRSDRSFRFELDGRVFEWGATLISGMTLKKLAGVDPATYGVWLEVRGAEDRPIAHDEFVDLSAPGVERFFTGITQTTEGLGCWRRSNSDPPCRPEFDPGLVADHWVTGCG